MALNQQIDLDQTVQDLTAQTMAPEEPLQVASAAPFRRVVKPREKPPVSEREIPAIPEERAEELLTTPEREVEMGRPSAYDPESRNINFDYLDTTDDVMQVIDDIGEQEAQFIGERRGTVTHEETLKEAEQFSLEDLLGRKPSDAFNAAQITSARQMLVQSAERLRTASKGILSGEASTAEMLSFRQMVAQHAAIQAQVSGMTAEAGRALNAFRIPAAGGRVQAQQLQEALQQSGGPEAAYKMAELFDQADSLEEVSKIARDQYHSTTGDMLLEYWINGLLSSPATHSVNMTSNAMVAVWQIPERFLAGNISKVMRSHEGVQIGEALSQIYGIVNGAKDGLRLFWKALKTGEPSDPAMKLESQRYRNITAESVAGTKWGQAMGVNPQTVADNGYLAQGIDLLGEALRIPGRFLTAEDELFKTIGYRMELNALAYRKAVGEGLEGDELAERIVDIMNKPPEEIHLGALEAGRYQTFTKPLGESGQQVQRLANSHPALKLLIPFVRTPVNIVKFVGERTPLGVFSKSIRADIQAGGARRDLALARMSMGSLVMSVGVMMASEGQITGGGPSNKGQRDAMRRQGWQPYSIKVGDKYHSFNRLDPLGMFLGLSADVVETMKYAESDEDRTQIATAASLALAKNLTSRTYLRGLSEFLAAMDDPDRYMERYIQRQSATWTPMTSLTAQIERQFDPTMRATYDIMDEIRGRTPGLSEDLMPRRNLWGEPVILEGGLGWDFVSPIYSSTWKPNIVDQQIVENEIDIRMPTKRIGTGRFAIELNAEEYDRYVVLAGGEFKDPSSGYGLRKYLEHKVIPSPEYENATDGPDGGRSVMIRSVINMFRMGAKDQLLKEFPGLKAEQEHQDLLRMEALTGLQQ